MNSYTLDTKREFLIASNGMQREVLLGGDIGMGKGDGGGHLNTPFVLPRSVKSKAIFTFQVGLDCFYHFTSTWQHSLALK